MAQTIWIHKLADAKKTDADGMDYICEHLFQALTQTGKLTKVEGWNPFQNASAKDGTTYRVLFCDSCAKNYNDGHVRMAKSRCWRKGPRLQFSPAHQIHSQTPADKPARSFRMARYQELATERVVIGTLCLVWFGAGPKPITAN